MTSTSKKPKTRREGSRPLPLEQVLARITDRDLRILHLIYNARAASTHELSRQFWPDSPIDSGGTSRAFRNRFALLEEWHLVRTAPKSENPAELVTGWNTPPEESLTPWGKVVYITQRGIRVLAMKGIIPEATENEQGELVKGYENAYKIKPAAGQINHALLTGAAVLRSINQHHDDYQWWGSRHILGVVHPSDEVLPDGLLAGPERTWGIEADKGTIHIKQLLARWKHQVSIWEQAQSRVPLLQVQGKTLPPLAGVLWYCADSKEERLYNRIWRLRMNALDEITFPPRLGWYVDSFDGLVSTFRRFLDPWTRGAAPHPQELLEQAVLRTVGKELARNIKCIAALGNLTAWQQVDAWASQATLIRPGRTRPGESAPPEWCVVLVRDQAEAKAIWTITDNVEDRLLIAVADDMPEGKLDLSEVVWCPGEGMDWRRVSLRDRIRNRAPGSPFTWPPAYRRSRRRG